MVSVDRRVGPKFFGQFPQYARLHRETIGVISRITPLSHKPAEAVAILGGTVLSFARAVGNVDPFNRGDWQNYVYHFELTRAQHAEDYPNPFNNWGELVARYEGDWRRKSGLTDHTILPIAQKVLDHMGLWTDESVRALVIVNLINRCHVDFAGMEVLGEYFRERIQMGSMPNADAARHYVGIIADNAGELANSRAIDYFRRSMSNKQMGKNAWRAFMHSPTGEQLGLFSTVKWLLEPASRGSSNVKMDTVRAINRAALENWLKDPLYLEFADNPDKAISDAIGIFKTTA